MLAESSQYIYGAVGGFSNLYPTQIIVAFGLSVARTTNKEYDFDTGLETRVTDADNDVATSTTYDAFGRPTLVKAAEGELEETQTTTVYNDVARRVIVRSDLATVGDGKLVSIKHYDQLGRSRLTRQLEDNLNPNDETDETKGIKAQTRYLYDGNFQYQLTSNPYRAPTSAGESPSSMGWTRSKTDNGGRLIEVETFSGATLPAPWGTNTASTGKVITSYDANSTTVTDQASKARRSVVDGLGRLIRVDEPVTTGTNLGPVDSPLQATYYLYDPLDNLIQTQQGTQQIRNFTYSSLSRLKSAQNPESGIVNYTYDNNGNLNKKTDARNVDTEFTYDQLNRVLTRTYLGPSPGGDTPDVTYAYDTATPAVTNSKGRLVSVSSSVSTYSYTSYDALGRVLACTQSTGGQDYTMSYQYNLAGGMTRETYPSTKEVVTEYDAAGRISGVKKDATTYYAGGTPASGLITYTPNGAIKTMKLGNNLVEHTNFNARLQPEQIGLGTSDTDSSKLRLDYGYGSGTTNNGNVMSQRIVISGSPGLDVRQDFTYDELNRLKSATEVTTSGSVQQWKQTYDYDRWGNRAVRTMPDSTIGITPLTPQSAFPGDMSAFNPANNRIQTSGFSYLDGAGNLTGDPSTGSQAMVYDGENRLIKYTKNGETQYSYDGDGHRVKKYDVNENVTTVFVYNAGGQLIAEYTNSTEPPAGGGGTSYLTTDHLGSTRVVTRADGSVKARYDYLPFGEDLGANVGQRTTGMGYSGDDATRQKFTQKERDNESGLDYFLARYYSSAQGRFTSPDEFVGGPDELYYFAAAAAGNPTFYSDLANPQSLNKYQYCYNNPLRYVDPDGHILETLWDVANALMGAASFAKNAKEGNVGAAIVDGLGVVVDVAAAVVPFVPGGVGTVIKVARGAENVVDAVQTADKVVDVAKAVDKVDDTKSIVNTGGRFGDLNKTKGADEVAHHIPQDALNRTTTGLSRADGPALGMTKADHALTNTFAGRGVKALREGLELTARQVVARDVRNVRSIAKSQHGNIRHYNQGLLQMIGYAKTLGPF